MKKLVLRVYARENRFGDLEFSYTPNGEKFIDVKFTGTSKPNSIGYWSVAFDCDKESAIRSNYLGFKRGGKQKLDKNGQPVFSKQGNPIVYKDLFFVNDHYTVEKDFGYESEMADKKFEAVNDILELDDNLDEFDE